MCKSKNSSYNRFIPVKRAAVDNTVWWVVWDKLRKGYSSYIFHGKYKTRKECQDRIYYWNTEFGDYFDKGQLYNYSE